MRLYIFTVWLNDPECLDLDELYPVFASNFEEALGYIRDALERYSDKEWYSIECWEYEAGRGVTKRVGRWVLWEGKWIRQR